MGLLAAARRVASADARSAHATGVANPCGFPAHAFSLCQVTLVAKLVRVQDNATLTTYTVDDGTGERAAVLQGSACVSAQTAHTPAARCRQAGPEDVGGQRRQRGCAGGA